VSNMAINPALIQMLLSLLSSSGGNSTSSNSSNGVAGILGRDTSDRSSTMNFLDPGGGLVDKDAAKARGLSTFQAVGANILDPTGFMGLGKSKKKTSTPTMEELLTRMKTWERSQPEYIAYKSELDKMTPETGYGAIQADWGDIMDRAIKKTQQVYRGSPTSTGIYDKARADVAARNMGNSPAYSQMLLKYGAQEENDISDISAALTEQERATKEAARQSYVNRLQNLSGYGTTAPDLTQLFELDKLQTPTQNTTNYSALGSSLYGLLGSENKTASVAPSSYDYTGAGSMNYNQTNNNANTRLSQWGF
jgi:hypothetical protein